MDIEKLIKESENLSFTIGSKRRKKKVNTEPELDENEKIREKELKRMEKEREKFFFSRAPLEGETRGFSGERIKQKRRNCDICDGHGKEFVFIDGYGWICDTCIRNTKRKHKCFFCVHFGNYEVEGEEVYGNCPYDEDRSSIHKKINCPVWRGVESVDERIENTIKEVNKIVEK